MIVCLDLVKDSAFEFDNCVEFVETVEFDLDFVAVDSIESVELDSDFEIEDLIESAETD